MNRIKKRKCCHCRGLFVPDHRNRNRQKYCSKVQCQKVSKAAIQKYWKRYKSQIALQDSLNSQHTENNDNNNKFTINALQDDIAHTLLATQQSGKDILCLEPQHKGGESDCQNSRIKYPYPQNPQKLQLGRSLAG